jgi:hypothetical protein
MRALTVPAVVAVLGASGCAGAGEERAFSCDRGFAAADWREHRLVTGRSIVKCHRLDGWSEARVVRALGRPEWALRGVVARAEQARRGADGLGARRRAE